MLVSNIEEGFEVAIPRGFFGEVSETDKPVRIVGLTQELEYKSGAVWPVAAPRSRDEGLAAHARSSQGHDTAPASGRTLRHHGHLVRRHRLQDRKAHRGRLRLAVYPRRRRLGAHPFHPLDQAHLRRQGPGLPRTDSRGRLQLTSCASSGSPPATVGSPIPANSSTADSSSRTAATRSSSWANKRESARYIGAVGLGADGSGWSPIHSIEFARGASTFSLLKSLPKF